MRREYPNQPIVGVGAVIIREGRILLARRGSEPGKNQWSIPGGLVELGETVRSTIIREVKEESSLDVEVHSLIDVVDNLVPDKKGRLRYHFIILDFFTTLKGGTPHAGSDALDVKWVPFEDVDGYDLTKTFREFFQRNKERLRHFDSTKKP